MNPFPREDSAMVAIWAHDAHVIVWFRVIIGGFDSLRLCARATNFEPFLLKTLAHAQGLHYIDPIPR